MGEDRFENLLQHFHVRRYVFSRAFKGKRLLRTIGLGHPCLCGEVVLHEVGVLPWAPTGVGSDPTQ